MIRTLLVLFGFKDYALFGDDVCIADEKMAKEWSSLMCALGVKIAWDKSLHGSADQLLEHHVSDSSAVLNN